MKARLKMEMAAAEMLYSGKKETKSDDVVPKCPLQVSDIKTVKLYEITFYVQTVIILCTFTVWSEINSISVKPQTLSFGMP